MIEETPVFGVTRCYLKKDLPYVFLFIYYFTEKLVNNCAILVFFLENMVLFYYFSPEKIRNIDNMRLFILSLNLMGVLLLGLFACSRPSSHPLLHRVDTLLMADRPDSAMILLKSLAEAEHLSQADQAYYAILLAAATDKLKLPLLPCDSLLNIALDYYGKKDRERARALLYKARLLAQMDDKKAAIEHNLEALKVLQAYPEDTLCRRLIYSPLGLWYTDCGLYDKALEVL